MDPSEVSLQQGAQTEAHATFTIGVAHVIETPAISDMYVTDVVDCTQGLTSRPTLCGNQSGKGGGIEIVTMETQSQVPLIESENTTCPLPTPINVRRLEETLTNHPDQEFVSKLCNNLRYGADVGFTGRRVARFSRNLPTALSQPNIVSGKWPLGELQVLSPAHHCPISKCPPSDWSPKNILLSLGPSFTYLSQNL